MLLTPRFQIQGTNPAPAALGTLGLILPVHFPCRQAFISSHLNSSSSLPPALPPASSGPLLHPPTQLVRPTASNSAPVICCSRDHAHSAQPSSGCLLRSPHSLHPRACARWPQNLCPRGPGLWPPPEVPEASEGREAAVGVTGHEQHEAPSSRLLKWMKSTGAEAASGGETSALGPRSLVSMATRV